MNLFIDCFVVLKGFLRRRGGSKKLVLGLMFGSPSSNFCNNIVNLLLNILLILNLNFGIISNQSVSFIILQVSLDLIYKVIIRIDSDKFLKGGWVCIDINALSGTFLQSGIIVSYLVLNKNPFVLEIKVPFMWIAIVSDYRIKN